VYELKRYYSLYYDGSNIVNMGKENGTKEKEWKIWRIINIIREKGKWRIS
jgi:ABC-type tungstate transport system permease subunit